MAECEKLATCGFIKTQLTAMPSIAEMLKRRFCFGDYANCARFQVAQKGLSVPNDLFPDDTDGAKALLRKKSYT